MRIHTRSALPLVAFPFVLVLVLGCDNDLPPAPQGAEVSGRVFYAGDGAATMSRPDLQVFAFTAWPPQGPPHSATYVHDPVFDEQGVPYALHFIPEGDWHVVAQLVDLDQPDAGSFPLGAHPSSCSLNDEPQGAFPLADLERRTDVDIVLYDGQGAKDPCNAPPADACPKEGAASMVLDVHTGLEATELVLEDSFSWALFEAWPAASIPAAFGTLNATDLEPDFTHIINDIEPGEYVVYVCYDRGSDNTQSLCAEGDLWTVLGDDAPISFAAATITTLEVDLAAATMESTGVQAAADAGCGDAPQLGAIRVTISSESVPISPGDSLFVAVFDESPPSPPPDGLVIDDRAQSFPYAITVDGLPPGDYAVVVCHDVGGNNLLCNGEGDRSVVYGDGELVDVEAGRTTEIALNLDGGSGPATLEVTVTSSTITPGAGDNVSVALFETFPAAGPPVEFAIDALTELPTVLVLEDVEPGDYFVSVCHDAGGDNMLCDGEGDVTRYYLGGAEPLTLAPGATEQIEVSLDPGPGAIEVTITSDTFVVEEGDGASVAVFDSYPPSGMPRGFQLGDITELPAVLIVPGVSPGQWYVSACLDKGGNSLRCDGEGDLSGFYMDGDQPVTVEADTTTQISVALP